MPWRVQSLPSRHHQRPRAMSHERSEQQIGFRLAGDDVLVDEFIAAASNPAHIAVGSVEGTLEAVTVHDTIAFSIYDAITHRRVECKCNREILEMAKNRYFGSRVIVSGLVSYNAQGDATSIKVDDVRALGNAHLPQAKDIRGLYSDHKVDIDEWARFVRED